MKKVKKALKRKYRGRGIWVSIFIGCLIIGLSAFFMSRLFRDQLFKYFITGSIALLLIIVFIGWLISFFRYRSLARKIKELEKISGPAEGENLVKVSDHFYQLGSWLIYNRKMKTLFWTRDTIGSATRTHGQDVLIRDFEGIQGWMVKADPNFNIEAFVENFKRPQAGELTFGQSGL